MHGQLVWFTFISLLAVAVSLSVMLAARLSAAGGGKIPLRDNVLMGLASALALVLVGLLGRVGVVARWDAGVVEQMSRLRKPTLESIFNIVTTMGDAIPATVIAAAIASVFFLRTRSVLAWILPGVVIVEQVLQVASSRVLDAQGISELVPDIVTGTGGSLPSGSVPRLFAIFMVAALLWGRRNLRAADGFRAAAAVLVLVQGVSRIYLSRHLLIDLVGGLSLALLLVAMANVAVATVERRWTRPRSTADVSPPRRARRTVESD